MVVFARCNLTRSGRLFDILAHQSGSIWAKFASELSWGDEFEAVDTDCTRSVCRDHRDWIRHRCDALALHAGCRYDGTTAKIWQPRRDQKFSLELFSTDVYRRRRDLSTKHAG